MMFALTPNASRVGKAVYNREVPKPAGMDGETVLARFLALDLARS